MPESRAEWVTAAANELHAIDGDMAALRWSIGTVYSSYRERLTTMKTGHLQVSRWVLTLEMIVCFIPLTWFGLEVAESALTGRIPASYAMPLLSAAVAGPLGLGLACRAIVFGRTQLNSIAHFVLLLIAVWTLAAYLTNIAELSGANVSDWWRDAVLLAVLPALGMIHLTILARQRSGQLVDT